MSFSTQSDRMLDLILNHTGIPLAQRIRLRVVSRRFRATLEDGLQRENSLVIRVMDKRDLEMLKKGFLKVEPNDLRLSVSNFTKMKNGLDLIQGLVPNATELTINSNSLGAWRKATELLRHYAPALTSLKVGGYLKKFSSQLPVFHRLVETINSMANLSSLHLPSGRLSRLLPQLGPTLSRLERFTFEEELYQKDAAFIATVVSSRCTHLLLNFSDVLDTLPPLHYATNLTHLHLGYFDGDTALQFVRRLPRLTTLILFDEIEADVESMLLNFPRLPQLTTQLTLLGLTFYRPLVRPASKALSFPFIKRLTLELYNLSPDDDDFNAQDFLSTVATWFPKLATCALHCPEFLAVRQEIIAIPEGTLPFTVKVLDSLEPTF